jgi:two-component system, LytTR family, sensor kinase
LRIAPPDQKFAGDLSPAAERELRRNTILLIVIFSVIHFGMLTLRVATVSLAYQAEIASARAVLTPFGALISYGIYVVLRRIRAEDFIRHALVGAALSAGAALLHGTVWSLFLNGLDPNTYAMTLATIAYQSLYWFLYYFAWTTAYLALSYSTTTREQERRFSALMIEAQDAKIRALRYQINPHFLFNALNSIAELIGEDREQAEKMVLDLAGFFRTSLEVDPMADVRLGDEIALQKLYLEMERVRFPERLFYSVEVPSELTQALVPSLILQPLIENAVKHGVGLCEEATRITIRAQRDAEMLHLSVANDAGERDERPLDTASGGGVGLDNVRNRLSARYGTDFMMTAKPQGSSGFTATMRFPLEFAPL